MAHVDPHQVHQLERAHSEAAAEPHNSVDLLVGCDPFLEQSERPRFSPPLRLRVDAALAHRLGHAINRDGVSTLA